jgi:hypothetical protein
VDAPIFTDRSDGGHLPTYEIGCQGFQPIVLPFRPTVVDPQILVLNKAAVFQTLAEGCD